MAQNQSAFEAMPLEIHFNVLSHMSGPEDVLSTIRASPAALRALQTGQERIYAAALQNGVAPEVFREFLAILNAPDHTRCPSVGPHQTDDEWAEAREPIREEWKTWAQRAGGFLHSHALGAVYSTPSPKTNLVEFKTQTRFMLRLYFCVSRHVNSYLTYAKSRVTGTRINLPPANQAGSEWPPLTDTERLRLQRGFLRYELCCRLIGMPSIAAYCNPQVFFGVSIASYPGTIRDFWESNPFTRLLPVDEMEEVICASEFVNGLYSRLRCTFIEDFQKATLDFCKGREPRWNQRSGGTWDKKTVGEWLSDDPLHGGYHAFEWGGQFGSRLGLVFLDRLMRSSPTVRREFMRAGFHTFRHINHDNFLVNRDDFLRHSWHTIVYLRGFATGQTSGLVVGPQCNAILKTCTTNYDIARRLKDEEPCTLRRLGWAFFDDESRLRSLDLPRDSSACAIHEWLQNEDRHPRPFCSARISESALAASLNEDEWQELIANYAPKDLGNDFEAMCRFVADARAIVDFSSKRVPQMG